MQLDALVMEAQLTQAVNELVARVWHKFHAEFCSNDLSVSETLRRLEELDRDFRVMAMNHLIALGELSIP